MPKCLSPRRHTQVPLAASACPSASRIVDMPHVLKNSLHHVVVELYKRLRNLHCLLSTVLLLPSTTTVGARGCSTRQLEELQQQQLSVVRGEERGDKRPREHKREKRRREETREH
ncbi:hypothetical protein Pcinc_018014 [Petrolisthes cinctipes]|uniref:Uncharacterized protein n=1 Tax=Petrolisthes cinctipes TaxID=88211 RepID=A0AAE1FN59_PETCI|nr:hypothetical protein Pcinc_018014 [Petrolisthes cinctipes]